MLVAGNLHHMFPVFAASVQACGFLLMTTSREKEKHIVVPSSGQPLYSSYRVAKNSVS